MRALPIEKKEVFKLPRAYIANIIRTVIGEEFERWVKDRVNTRNQKVQDEREVGIFMDPTIEAIFRQSTATSGKYFRIDLQIISELGFFSNSQQRQQFEFNESKCF